MDASSVLDILRQAIPGVPLDEAASIDMPTLYIEREHLVDVCRVLRDDPTLQFALLVEITAADYFPREPRFELIYHLACLGEAFRTADVAAPPRRLRLKVRLAGDAAHAPTVHGVWAAAGWLEREVFDLFGIVFEGHPDLRRILMPDGWEGYPLRKDAPVQIRKDVPSWQPIQLTPEEFARNVREARERAVAGSAVLRRE